VHLPILVCTFPKEPWQTPMLNLVPNNPQPSLFLHHHHPPWYPHPFCCLTTLPMATTTHHHHQLPTNNPPHTPTMTATVWQCHVTGLAAERAGAVSRVHGEDDVAWPHHLDGDDSMHHHHLQSHRWVHHPQCCRHQHHTGAQLQSTTAMSTIPILVIQPHPAPSVPINVHPHTSMPIGTQHHPSKPITMDKEQPCNHDGPHQQTTMAMTTDNNVPPRCDGHDHGQGTTTMWPCNCNDHDGPPPCEDNNNNLTMTTQWQHQTNTTQCNHSHDVPPQHMTITTSPTPPTRCDHDHMTTTMMRRQQWQQWTHHHTTMTTQQWQTTMRPWLVMQRWQ